MSFAARMTLAQAFETEVAEALEFRGWMVEPYGQALLSERARQILRSDPHAQHRWLPDLLAMHPGRATRVLIDAKASEPANRSRPNFTMEKAALAALCDHERSALMPLYIVFYDWTVARACELWEGIDTGYLRTGPPPSSGSGTPYWLIKRDAFPRTFDNTFGHIDRLARQPIPGAPREAEGDPC